MIACKPFSAGLNGERREYKATLRGRPSSQPQIRVAFGLSAEVARLSRTVATLGLTTTSLLHVVDLLPPPLTISTSACPKMDSESEEEVNCHHGPFLDRLATPTGLLEYEDYTRAALSPTESYAAIRLCHLVERTPVGVGLSNKSQRRATWRDALTLIQSDVLRSFQRELPLRHELRKGRMKNWCWHVADGLRSLEARLGHPYFHQDQPVRALLYLRQSYGQDPSAAQVYTMVVSLISSSKCEGPPNRAHVCRRNIMASCLLLPSRCCWNMCVRLPLPSNCSLCTLKVGPPKTAPDSTWAGTVESPGSL